MARDRLVLFYRQLAPPTTACGPKAKGRFRHSSQRPHATRCGRSSGCYHLVMNSDLRVSLKVWASVIAFVTISWALLRSDLFQGLTDRLPSNWIWLFLSVTGVWNLGRFGLGLWQRRASRAK